MNHVRVAGISVDLDDEEAIGKTCGPITAPSLSEAIHAALDAWEATK